MLVAGQVSLTIGIVASGLSLIIGAAVGLAAGYFGGRTDSFLMWMVNVLMTVPPLPLLIGVSVLVASPHSSIGALIRNVPEAWRIILVLSSFGWMGFSRIIRSQVLANKRLEYVEACKSMGAGHLRRMLVHVLPNSMPAMVVFATFGVSGAIMGESFLSFLGVGVNQPTPTWGNMISQSSDIGTILNHTWLLIVPSVAIFVTVLAVNFVGEGLRTALDPRTGRRT